jgi:hypothetical protein
MQNLSAEDSCWKTNFLFFFNISFTINISLSSEGLVAMFIKKKLNPTTVETLLQHKSINRHEGHALENHLSTISSSILFCTKPLFYMIQ